jgi:hypothetical protein
MHVWCAWCLNPHSVFVVKWLLNAPAAAAVMARVPLPVCGSRGPAAGAMCVGAVALVTAAAAADFCICIAMLQRVQLPSRQPYYYNHCATALPVSHLCMFPIICLLLPTRRTRLPNTLVAMLHLCCALYRAGIMHLLGVWWGRDAALCIRAVRKSCMLLAAARQPCHARQPCAHAASVVSLPLLQSHHPLPRCADVDVLIWSFHVCHVRGDLRSCRFGSRLLVMCYSCWRGAGS